MIILFYIRLGYYTQLLVYVMSKTRPTNAIPILTNISQMHFARIFPYQTLTMELKFQHFHITVTTF